MNYRPLFLFIFHTIVDTKHMFFKKIANHWIRTEDLLSQDWLLCQLRHNHVPFNIKRIKAGGSSWKEGEPNFLATIAEIGWIQLNVFNLKLIFYSFEGSFIIIFYLGHALENICSSLCFVGGGWWTSKNMFTSVKNIPWEIQLGRLCLQQSVRPDG